MSIGASPIGAHPVGGGRTEDYFSAGQYRNVTASGSRDGLRQSTGTGSALDRKGAVGHQTKKPTRHAQIIG